MYILFLTFAALWTRTPQPSAVTVTMAPPSHGPSIGDMIASGLVYSNVNAKDRLPAHIGMHV